MEAGWLERDGPASDGSRLGSMSHGELEAVEETRPIGAVESFMFGAWLMWMW